MSTPDTATHSNRGIVRLCIFFFLHAQALGFWGMNLGNVLKAYGYEDLVYLIFASTSIAALISPLAVGALADQRVPPEKILRVLGLGSATFLGLFYYGISQQWSPLVILALGQIHALWSVPTFGLTTSLVLSRLHSPQRQFGPVRLWATLGWMSAGWLISWVLMADKSVVSGYAACVVWVIAILFSFTIPPSPPLPATAVRKRSWKEILGLDALHLLRHPDHKVVFITAGLLNMALAAFYPFTPLHLEDLGVSHVTAAMSVGQVTEIISMMWLSIVLTRFRLKWIFLAGIGFGVARYLLFILDTRPALYTGIFMHGFCFTLFVITAQIYMEQRIPNHMRARAQALLTLMMNGVGNLAGYILFGWWRQQCQYTTADGVLHTHWAQYWLGMALVTTGVFIFFALAYKGKKDRPTPGDPDRPIGTSTAG